MPGQLLRRDAGILVMIALFCLAVGAAKPHFLTLDSACIILLLVPLIMIGAMGEMLVIVAGRVDLSIGVALRRASLTHSRPGSS